ncbi:MAG: NIPSNAP family protein [Nocardioides sp.]
MLLTNSAVVELRQYTLKPGARDTLVAIFEAEFVASQEELGIALGGRFEDRDDPDRFVWMRGFASMEARREALQAFYFGSEAWKTHGPAANATMIDSDDVLLLRPTDPPHPQVDELGGDVQMTVYLHAPGHGTCDRLTRALGTDVAAWRTEPAENSFPALPVRPDHAFVAMRAAGEPAPAIRGVTTQELRLRRIA